ncbi:hypothetical protein ABZ725_03250 [Streptomyces sp. NPDC006872]|uniref:hypothetical protein n=1 Tax=Streptomyces sp. NPDC006872 TaxID=3155720 RepID=UPI0033C47F19
MTSSLLRGRPRRSASHISVRVAHAALGGAVGVVWLVLPGMTSGADAPVAIKGPTPAASAAVAQEDERSTVDLVLPLAAVAVAGTVAGYAYIRRVRRTRDRTTPGGTGSPPPRTSSPPLAVPDEQACAALVAADNRMRAARAELGFAEALFGAEAVAEFRRAVREAEHELAAAFRMRQRYDEGVPAEAAARGHALAGIVGRCEEAGRRLDAVADDFQRLRGLEHGGLGEALGVAEGRFRELAGRAGASEAVLAGLRTRYAPTATASVTGNVEQAKDRLVFATSLLNEARQSADSGRPEQAARHLRAAEGAVDQAAVLVEGVDRLAAQLRTAEQTVPAALTGAETELSWIRDQEQNRERQRGRERDQEQERAAGGAAPARQTTHDLAATPPGELHSRLAHADAVLASVRQELTRGQLHDPVGVLRRIVRATAPVASGRAGVLPAAALLTARVAVAAAADFVATHRGAVGAAARTRLAEAERLLATGDPADRPPADALALEARELAELDVRAHGNPYAGPGAAGVGGAVLGGIVPAEDPGSGTPPGFAGPAPG